MDNKSNDDLFEFIAFFCDANKYDLLLDTFAVTTKLPYPE